MSIVKQRSNATLKTHLNSLIILYRRLQKMEINGTNNYNNIITPKENGIKSLETDVNINQKLEDTQGTEPNRDRDKIVSRKYTTLRKFSLISKMKSQLCWKYYNKRFNHVLENKYIVKTLKFMSPLFTRGVVVIVWCMLIMVIVTPDAGHYLEDHRNESSLHENSTLQQVLNKTTINVTKIEEDHLDFRLEIIPSDNKHIVASLINEDAEYLEQLKYKIQELPQQEIISSSDTSQDMLSNPNSILSLCLLTILAGVFGFLFKLIRLPPLLGMLLAGIIFTHIPLGFISEEFGFPAAIPKYIASTLRKIGLCIILTRGGLGIAPSKLKARAFEIIRLAVIPCLVETAAVGLSTYFILQFERDYWAWAAMAGCSVAAVSPAIVLPQMLKLQNNGYGTRRGLPTMIIASSSFDDVIAISLFFVFLALGMSKSNIAFTIIRGPLELIAGFVYGVLAGIIGYFISWREGSGSIKRNRFMYLLGVTLLSILGSNAILINGSSFGGAGAVGVLTSSFACSLGWGKGKKSIELSLKIVWELVQPVLFGLIGYEINFVKEECDVILIVKVLGVLVIGLACRSIVAFLVVSWVRDFTLKEKLFVPIAWLPKATVQAAIGLVALDVATTEQQVYYGKIILYVAVFSILLSAPLGAILTNLLGKRMVSRDETSPKQIYISSETASTDTNAKDSTSGMINKESNNTTPTPTLESQRQ